MMKKGLVVFFTIMGLCEVGIVNASVFYIDQFTVEKTDGGVTTTYFQDTFGDGVAPKNISEENPATVDVNPEDRAYLLPFSQLPGPETGGKLALDTAEGQLNLSPISNQANLFLGARVNSSQTNGSAALWEDDQFVVEGRFDLTLPQQTSERYGIRITDWTSTTQTEDIEITLLRRTDGEIRILFRQADFLTNMLTVIEGWNPTNNPNFGEFEQISLSIFNDPSDSDMFFASFTLFDNDNIFDDATRTSTSTGQMFQVSDWVRPEFFAVRVFTIPEPTTIFLMSLGLTVIGFKRQRGGKNI